MQMILENVDDSLQTTQICFQTLGTNVIEKTAPCSLAVATLSLQGMPGSGCSHILKVLAPQGRADELGTQRPRGRASLLGERRVSVHVCVCVRACKCVPKGPEEPSPAQSSKHKMYTGSASYMYKKYVYTDSITHSLLCQYIPCTHTGKSWTCS